MELIYQLNVWTNRLLVYGVLAISLWAVIDCAIRKQAAFPATGKLTKPAWLAIVLIGGGLGSLIAYSYMSVMNPITLVALIASLVYLTDVRPAVREVGGTR